MPWDDPFANWDAMAMEAVVNTTDTSPLLILRHKGSNGARTAVPSGLPYPASVPEETHLEIIDYYGDGLHLVPHEYPLPAQRVGLRVVCLFIVTSPCFPV